MIQIGVIGAQQSNPTEYSIAEDVGREVGRAGYILVCGGLGGVMEAAAKGAKSGGGLTVGILPGEDASSANEFIDVKVVTAMSHARNAIIARTADVLIAVGGGAGTLSEIALALKTGKPVITLKDAPNNYSIEGEGIYVADSTEEAMALINSLTKKVGVST